MPLESVKKWIHYPASSGGLGIQRALCGQRIDYLKDYIDFSQSEVTCDECRIELKKKSFGIGGMADLSGQDHKYAEGFAAGVKSVKDDMEDCVKDLRRDIEDAETQAGVCDAVFPVDPKWNDKTKLDRATGVKYDQDKLRYDLISPMSNEATAKVLTYGAKKYNDRNWENGIAYSRLYRAALGHLQDFWRRNDIDSESSLRHLDHAAANIHMLQHLSIVGPKMDDRPKYNVIADDGGSSPAPLIVHYPSHQEGLVTLCNRFPDEYSISGKKDKITCVACIQSLQNFNA